MSQQHKTILVVGGTGTVGSALTEALLKAGHTVKVASRQPEKVGDTFKGAVGVSLAFGDAGSIGAALEGTDALFVLAPGGHTDQFGLLAPLLTAATKDKARKVVTMTANGVQYDDSNALRRLELLVSSSGAPFVHLRPGWFMQNFQTYWLPGIQATGQIMVPAADARSSFIDVRDIADVAVVALATDTVDGEALTLTGPEALTYGEAAAILSAASEKPIGYTALDEATFEQGLLQAGVSADYARVMLALFSFVRQGAAAEVTSTVADILGRARTLKDYAREHAALWRR